MAKFNVIALTETEKTSPIEVKEVFTDELPVEKIQEFEAFLLWSSIPVFFKRPPKDKKTGVILPTRDFLYSMGIEDEFTIELAELTTQGDFCDRFKVNKDTLTTWKKLIQERDLLGDLRLWAKPLTRNVMMAHYNACIRGGLPEHFKLWYQVSGDFKEKSEIEINKRSISVVRVHVIDPKEST